MIGQDHDAWVGFTGYLPYREEEKEHAERLLYVLEYHVWQEWREAWSNMEEPQKAASMQEAVMAVSERQFLGISAVEEIIGYAERVVSQASRHRPMHRGQAKTATNHRGWRSKEQSF